jgi:hypothetical protein
MLNSGKKNSPLTQKKKKSNPRVVRKKISERNKKIHTPPPCKFNGWSQKILFKKHYVNYNFQKHLFMMLAVE